MLSEGSMSEARGYEEMLDRLVLQDIERKAFERAACIVESLQGNPTYSQAWRLAARAIRCAKPS